MLRPSIIAIIPARGGSRGVPRKNIKLLSGVPLIAHTIAIARQSSYITETIVSTDDQEIACVAQEWGGYVPFMRPDNFATDTVTMLPVITHAVKHMEQQHATRYEFIVILQPTSPLRTVEDVDETIKRLIESGADSAVSLVVVEGKSHPMKMKKIVNTMVVPYCIDEPEGALRQELPTVYQRSGAVYAMKRDVVLDRQSLYGSTTVGHVVSRDRSIDIDTMNDWVLAELMHADLLRQGVLVLPQKNI